MSAGRAGRRGARHGAGPRAGWRRSGSGRVAAVPARPRPRPRASRTAARTQTGHINIVHGCWFRPRLASLPTLFAPAAPVPLPGLPEPAAARPRPGPLLTLPRPAPASPVRLAAVARTLLPTRPHRGLPPDGGGRSVALLPGPRPPARHLNTETRQGSVGIV